MVTTQVVRLYILGRSGVPSSPYFSGWHFIYLFPVLLQGVSRPCCVSCEQNQDALFYWCDRVLAKIVEKIKDSIAP
jgi:hypothetical protein